MSAKYKAYFHFRSKKKVIPLFHYSVIPYSVLNRLPLASQLALIISLTILRVICKVTKTAFQKLPWKLDDSR